MNRYSSLRLIFDNSVNRFSRENVLYFVAMHDKSSALVKVFTKCKEAALLVVGLPTAESQKELSKSMPEEDAYYESVKRLMEMKSDSFISNGMPQHAAILFECFFLNAEKSIQILCKDLNAAVFDIPDVLRAVKKALKKGVKIDVLVQDAPEPNSQFLTLRDDNLTIVTEAAKKSSFIKERPENFAVMDERAFRYEDDSAKVVAWASMNQPELAQKLSKVFDRLKRSLPKA